VEAASGVDGSSGDGGEVSGGAVELRGRVEGSRYEAAVPADEQAVALDEPGAALWADPQLENEA
jgi:hypothetical protein